MRKQLKALIGLPGAMRKMNKAKKTAQYVEHLRRGAEMMDIKKQAGFVPAGMMDEYLNNEYVQKKTKKKK